MLATLPSGRRADLLRAASRRVRNLRKAVLRFEAAAAEGVKLAAVRLEAARYLLHDQEVILTALALDVAGRGPSGWSAPVAVAVDKSLWVVDPGPDGNEPPRIVRVDLDRAVVVPPLG